MYSKVSRKVSVNVLVVLSLSLLAWGRLEAETWYVDRASGSVIEDGTRPHPFRTIQRAIAWAAAGDKIRVAAGTYDENIALKSGVKVYAGAVVVIDGGRRGPTVTAIGVNAAARLDGFTITGGLSEPDGGGGLHFEDSRAVVANCTIEGNRGDRGGGMYNYDSSPYLYRCVFRDNRAGSGGGMFNGWGSSPRLTLCTFENNFGDCPAEWDPNQDASVDCAGPPPLGGAVENHFDCSPEFRDCRFVNNEANYGGAIHNRRSHAWLLSCTFEGNRATWGTGGGICNEDYSTSSVTNTVFWRNTANDGGAIYSTGGSTSRVKCCSFYRNQATQPGREGGAIGTYGTASYSFVKYCVLWRNSPEQIDSRMGATADVTYSDVEDPWGVYPGVGNINEDPIFVAPDLGNFHLQSTSPCVDAGPESPSDIPARDFEGDRRVLDGDGDGDEVMDMGADERRVPGTILPAVMTLRKGARRPASEKEDSPPFIRGDVNASGKVDLSDTIDLLRSLFSGGHSPSCLAAADANADGTVDLGDGVYGLEWLLAGGLPPASPGPYECGWAPEELTPLGCESFPPCDASPRT